MICSFSAPYSNFIWFDSTWNVALIFPINFNQNRRRKKKNFRATENFYKVCECWKKGKNWRNNSQILSNSIDEKSTICDVHLIVCIFFLGTHYGPINKNQRQKNLIKKLADGVKRLQKRTKFIKINKSTKYIELCKNIQDENCSESNK